MTKPAASAHRWRFFRAGGFDQVKLDTGADLDHLEQLDQKLWVALACPTTGLEFDPKTLALIDADKDGRVRAPELIAAVKWACSLLKNPADLIKGGDSLLLNSINDAIPEGARLLASARQILADLGHKDAPAITLADASDTTLIFANTTFNGDGVIIAESADDETTRAVINDIASCLGTVPDRSGKVGIDQARVELFFAECAALDGWMKKAEADAKIVWPAGDGTPAAAAAVLAIKAKVDDYFGRCRLAAFDPRAAAILNRQEQEYVAIAAKSLDITAAEIAGFPLAQVAAGKPLPLKGPVNPAHAAALAALQTNAVKPLLGDKAELTEAEWIALQARLGAYECWHAAKAGAAVEKLGVKRVRQILASPARAALEALLAKDKELEPQAASIDNVEKLIRYQRDLYVLCVNFVNFKSLYSDRQAAIFQCGTLFLDQRACHLCLTVDDAGRHATMAALAGAYLAYCDCVRKATGEKKSIVAIISQGDDDNLMVGRNGLFYDRKGFDYDATITKIVSNPISLRQAFWLPYKKLVRLIEEQIAKRAAAAEAASDAKLAQTASATAQADKAPAGPRKIDVGTVAALGVAFGAIGTFAAAIAGYAMGVIRLGPLAIVGAILAVMALISCPSMVLAYIKLRKRNLGPILDANGWAVNARAKINVPFGTALTEIARLPAGSSRDFSDPFREKKSPWPRLIVLALVLYCVYVILNHLGFIYQWTHGRLGIEKKKATSSQLEQTAPPTQSTTNMPAAN
jgi:hypothetical protein